MRRDLVDALVAASNAPGTSLAHAALTIARIEYPKLDPEPYVGRLDASARSTAISSTICSSWETAIATKIRATAA
jgi:hypothetical protein